MAQSKHQYHRSGHEWHAKSDITVDLKRPDVIKMANWTTAEREGLPEFIAMAEASFKEFINTLKIHCNGTE